MAHNPEDPDVCVRGCSARFGWIPFVGARLGNAALGQLTFLTEKNAAGTVTKTWGWAYDASGNRTHEVEGTAMRLAAIGAANRLDQVGGAGNALFEGTLDEPGEVTVNGQPATVRALPGGAQHLFSKELALGAGTHQVQIEATDLTQNTTQKTYSVTVGGVERTLTYDTNGNLIREAVAGGSTRVFEWDDLNRLTAIQSDETPVATSWRTEMTYDGQSRRIRLVEEIRTGSSWTTQNDHRYLWEGTTIVQKRDATGAAITGKYYDQGEIRVSGSTATPYHFTRDHLRSVREVVASNGTVSARFDYTAWGERSTVSGGSFELEWGFTGHHYHAKSGLHLAMFRAYDANLGRWLSEDPIGEAGGVNLYGYAIANPVAYIDPNGRTPVHGILGLIEAANIISSTLIGAGVGAVTGGLTAHAFSCPEGRWRNTFAGAFAGAVGGGVGGLLSSVIPDAVANVHPAAAVAGRGLDFAGGYLGTHISYGLSDLLSGGCGAKSAPSQAKKEMRNNIAISTGLAAMLNPWFDQVDAAIIGAAAGFGQGFTDWGAGVSEGGDPFHRDPIFDQDPF